MMMCAMLFAAVVISGRERHNFLGAGRCSEACHNGEATGNQYKLWQSSPHARAVRDLATEKAREIALKVSANDPASNRECLSCHTTGGGKHEITKDEGVGCEACHGPGSGYYSASDHVDYLDREGAYMKAIKKGMYPVLSIVDSHLKKREKLCLSCHNESRPCYPEDPGERVKQKITIQVIDKLVKGDVDLRHPLRR